MSLREELEAVLCDGTDEEREILRLSLQAIRQKRERNSAYPSGFLGLAGKFTDSKSYRFRIPITPYMLNRGGFVHGGITATLVDSTMGSLVNRSLPDERFAVTAEMKVHYLQPGRGEELISTAHLLQMGQTLAVTECRVENEQGRLIALATATFSLQKKPGL
ncbi:PaaI family thioesterase [Desmospora profundinema]|uniref:Uncharacterized protein (TIGR00369 family) n=1 Tax=Desmospora profundinema TaxID=1571184 RepID=A0ABU1IMW8_9BACL|nr:PaaI family thioesterase [Desmospora profundinema]MDR6225314.1 uncharacterized protein (TIGR00369 family) [Desmospora profundinema]